MSIFDGFDTLINGALKLTPKQSIDHKTICKNLCPTDEIIANISPLVFSLYNQIEKNWQGRIPSDKNWKLRRQTELASHNKSPETLLERAIVILAKRKILDGWYNQIPIASGLIDGHADKKAGVDLIHLKDKYLELVELKYESNTPLYAIFEILRYGLTYLFCYNNRHAFGYQDLPVMNISKITFSTLAPAKYYSDCNLQWLVEALKPAVNETFIKSGLTCDFSCNAFTDDFSLSFTTGEDVRSLEKISTDDASIQRLADHVNNRSVTSWNGS